MDCYQNFGGDLNINSRGDLLLAEGLTLSQQRILRRLLTNPGDYIWHPEYGAGLPRYIGQPLTQALFKEISGLITAHIYLERTVAQNPPPVIKLSANQSSLYCNITYTDAATTSLQVLTFNVSQ